MSKKCNARPAVGRGTAAASLVALVACSFAGDALASLPPAESSAGERELSARVATIAARIRLVEPTIASALPPARKLAQWRNV